MWDGVFGLIGCQSPSHGLALTIFFNNNNNNNNRNILTGIQIMNKIWPLTAVRVSSGEAATKLLTNGLY